MARGVNKVIIVGGLGADPEVKYGPSGNAITSISVATSEQWTDKNTGQKQERTEWHRVTLFNRLGEIAGEFLKKGSQVYIEGSIRTDNYYDKNTGETKYSTGIIARDMQMLGGGSGRDDAGSNATAPQAQRQAPAGGAPVGGGSTDFDDSIPF